MLERIVIFLGKFAMLVGSVALALFVGATFVFKLIKASDHISGLGAQDWIALAFVVSLLLLLFQKLAEWVYKP